MRRIWSPLLLVALLAVSASTTAAQSGRELRFCLPAEPKTFHPLVVADDSSETIRYLTGGALIRFNRQTQELQPELAASWKQSEAGREKTVQLRAGNFFLAGIAFSRQQVAF